MQTIRNIQNIIARHFPEKCAESWDNPGLQMGHQDASVSRILTALELTPAVLDEAVDGGFDLIVTHHPFIFRPFKRLTDETADGRMLLRLAENHIGLLAAHTNLDSAPGAIADKLADDLHLSDRRPVIEHHPYEACKIIVFVPSGHADAVSRAMHDAGAGCVGRYSDVSFRTSGTGYFTCGNDTHPAIGAPGQAVETPEVRLEMVVSEQNLKPVLRAVHETHPYEEPAVDVFRLSSDVHGISDLYGFGTTGRLPAPMLLKDFIPYLKKLWDISSLRAAGDPEKRIERVGILNGSGAKYMSSCRDVDAFITGDCGHHDFDNAVRCGVALIDAGHYETEKFIPEILAGVIANDAETDELVVKIASAMSNPCRTW